MGLYCNRLPISPLNCSGSYTTFPDGINPKHANVLSRMLFQASFKRSQNFPLASTLNGGTGLPNIASKTPHIRMFCPDVVALSDQLTYLLHNVRS
jgi:hypothetical protein